jgi:formylglycine-generating enzyme required for sulfatase activity
MSSSTFCASAARARLLGRGLPVLLGLLLALPAWAQSVIRVGEGSVTLSVGASEGVRRGMTGKLATSETVSGQRVDVFVAEFEVTEVRESSSTARVTRGSPGEIRVGFRAIFNQRLEPPPKPRPTPQPAPRELSAEELLARGNRLFDVKDWAGAAAAFAELLRRFPAHPEVVYARKLLAGAEKWAEADVLSDKALMLNGTNERARAASARAESQSRQTHDLSEPHSGIRFVPIPAGTFRMGCTAGDSECDPDERPTRDRTISRPYLMAERETTVAQYHECVTANACSEPGRDQGEGDHPVVNVSWYDANDFCKWVGGRLPTDPEWEYAARGGLSGWRYPWGNSITHDHANYFGTGGKDFWEGTSPTCSFARNAFGLCDTSGNAWEWTADVYSRSLSDDTRVSGVQEASSATPRTLRGGGWGVYVLDLRVSDRSFLAPDVRYGQVGFRCAK